VREILGCNRVVPVAHHLDYLDHIRVESERLVDALQAAPSVSSVPSCPGWSAADLAWHIGTVQSFWAAIVAGRLQGPESVEAARRPDSYRELIDFFAASTPRLLESLSGAEPDEHVWTWASDQSVAFVLRRQAHEVLVHGVDGRLAAGWPLMEIDEALAEDGIDELLNVMIAGVPSWGEFELDGSTLRIDSGSSHWGIGFGRFAGTSPVTGKSYDLDACELVDFPEHPDALIRGPSGLVDLWLWGRAPSDAIEMEGDATLVDRLRKLVAEATQ